MFDLTALQRGGRQTAVKGDFYACPIFIDGEGFDCRIFIKGRTLELGKWYELPVKFLNKDHALPKLTVGKSVTLWEGKTVGEGKVLRFV